MEQAKVRMYLEGPQGNATLGVPPTMDERANQNPFYQAMQLDQQGKHAEAEKLLNELLNSDFDNVALHAALGMNYATQERSGLAFRLLLYAHDHIDQLWPSMQKLGISPKPGTTDDHVESFINIKRSEILNALGTCHKIENRTELARDFFERAQSTLPINPDIQNNLGTLFINEGNPAEALTHLDMALGVDPNHPQAHWNRALAYLELGRYAEGWPEYDWGLNAHVRVERNYTTQAEPPLPYWNGEKDAVVALYGEQGIGDEIMFASMVPDLIGATKQVVFECHRKLHKLFAHSFPGIDMYATREDPTVAWPIKNDGHPRYPFTHRAAIGSLGKFFRQSIDKFPGTPYINPTPEAELRWAEELAKLPPGPRIGISWVGGHKKTRVEVRSLQLEALLPIIQQEGAQFISLQYTPHEAELKAIKEKYGITIHQFPDACYSGVYDDTAGLVSQLDLVITVCTSLVHLAGSMGVPTWVMTPSRPAWRYRLDLDGMPWYGNVQLFRQGHGSTDWKPVVEKVAAELHDLLFAIKPKEVAA